MRTSPDSLGRRIATITVRYFGAAGLVGVAIVLTRKLLPHLDPGSSPFYFAAVVLSAWWFGFGPGLLATILAGTFSAAIYHEEGYSLDVGSDDFLRVIAFLAVAVLINWMHESSRRARREAELANAAKDRFFAVLSHELRNPLVPIQLIADSYSEDPTITPELREEMQMIGESVRLEARLINDMLDATRIRTGKLALHKEMIDVSGPLRAAITISRENTSEKRLAIVEEFSADQHHVIGDPARLQQIFWNLLNNAVKFTPAGGRVCVSVTNTDRDLILHITDTGVGIDPKILPRLFSPFEQGETSTTERFGGLGLGLSITRGLVEAHGGTISVASEGLGRGTRFTVTLPLTKDSDLNRSNAPLPQPHQGKSLDPIPSLHS